jgi:hypothetical protein
MQNLTQQNTCIHLPFPSPPSISKCSSVQKTKLPLCFIKRHSIETSWRGVEAGSIQPHILNLGTVSGQLHAALPLKNKKKTVPVGQHTGEPQNCYEHGKEKNLCPPEIELRLPGCSGHYTDELLSVFRLKFCAHFSPLPPISSCVLSSA